MDTGVRKVKSVRLENVRKTFGGQRGVEEVDIEIRPGEFFTFLGPSGCGKTTTLRMIAGFYYPTSGRILFDGQDVTYWKPEKRNIGMVFQNYALFPHMTVFENVAFGLEVRRLSRNVIKEKTERAIRMVHLEGYGNRKITELSGGQQQRVALARALVIEPGILLLDEPLSNLDAKLREETRIEIKRLQTEIGVTTVYVTHDQTEAMTMSDRIMVMKDGVVQQVGSPQEIYNRPVNQFVASFIGESNLLDGEVLEVQDGRAAVDVGGNRLIGLAANASPNTRLVRGAKVKLLVRPESVMVGDGPNPLTGTVLLAEFKGFGISYLMQAGPLQLKAMSVNVGRGILQRGDEVTVHIPEQGIYFIGE